MPSRKLFQIEIQSDEARYQANCLRSLPGLKKNVDITMKAYEGEHSDVVKIELEEKGRKDAEEAEKRKFPCQYCGKRMTKAEYRKVHIQKKHPGKKFN